MVVDMAGLVPVALEHQEDLLVVLRDLQLEQFQPLL
tara:strand:+ start:16 stop:123 length:108 start_codon:yes stop_codon:yes gene_type:complete